ncbi:MAG: orotate phosphoribosyltransferase, partial [Eubacteriales bacterium]|nr:orotate phosphoribosyltransferase [Eubacteriales bacterium]
MCDLNKDLVNWIFETDAIKVAEPDKPFWYTSGTIGPYYVNTHYLYGGEEKAGKMLALIEGAKNEPLSCTGKVLENEIENYKNDTIYKAVIDRMISFAKEYIGSENFDFISGGERRDWFFSVIAAHLLRKP